MNGLLGQLVILGTIPTLTLLVGVNCQGPGAGLGKNGRSKNSRRPQLFQQGKSDIGVCDANLDASAPSASARACMSPKGYALVQKDQAEEVRAA
jgi:hypothetical protein